MHYGNLRHPQLVLLKSMPFPKEGLRYPKTTEQPAFQTWAEIERRVERGGLTPEQQADLWDCLFLTLPEVEAVLEHVRLNAAYPFLYPMFLLLHIPAPDVLKCSARKLTILTWYERRP